MGKAIIYPIVLAAFGYGVFKLYLQPEQATAIDLAVAMGSIVFGTIVTLFYQLKTKRKNH